MREQRLCFISKMKLLRYDLLSSTICIKSFTYITLTRVYTIVQKTLYNVWNATLSLWDSVIRKRINLHQLKLELKLNAVLNDQVILIFL